MVFASFDDDVKSFEDYIGPTILGYFDRLFNGRKLKILGYNRQRVPCNWNLMQENIKDPYHPGMLHTWFVTFGLWRADNKSQLRMDDRHRHAAMISTRGNAGKVDQVTQVSSFKEEMKLHDPRFIDIVPEGWWGGPTAVMTTIFPSVILQQQVNSVSTRHIQPTGHGSFDFAPGASATTRRTGLDSQASGCASTPVQANRPPRLARIESFLRPGSKEVLFINGTCCEVKGASPRCCPRRR